MHATIFTQVINQTRTTQFRMEYRAAFLMVLCSLLLHTTIIGCDVALYHTLGTLGSIVFMGSQALSYLLYPLLGWMADVCFTRYKFVVSSYVAMIIGSTLMIVTAVLVLKFPEHRLSLYSIAGLSIIIGLIGIGLFESTAVQFGMDQMLEASSNRLSIFIHWYYWSSNVGHLIILYVIFGVKIYFGSCTITTKNHSSNSNTISSYQITIAATTVLVLGCIQLVTSCIGLCVMICCKRHLNIDRTGEHPLKLIYQVLKYAWKHKCPENRSAFTYWEYDIPPRIDLGKRKYGGPFDTEEVEDTKTFLRIIILFLSLLGFHLSGHSNSIINQLAMKQCPSYWMTILGTDPMNFILITTIIGIPTYQLVVVHRCHKYAPNMLKRMGLGLLCCLVKEVIEIVIHATMVKGKDCNLAYDNPIVSCYFILAMFSLNGTCSALPEYQSYCNENNTPFLLMFIPNILEGFAFLLVFMTTLEFICAQAPLRLKGLLIGIWYALLAINYTPLGISEPSTNSITWEVFHEVKAFLIFISLMLFLHVSKWYRYRQRDEVVNEQFLVEEIYERELAQAELYEEEQQSETRSLLNSVHTVQKNSFTV